MRAQISDNDIFIEAPVNCLECHYLHRPNPNEDQYLCLRALEKIFHEIDMHMTCIEYEVIRALWKPVYVEEYQNYI
jgi:hypothetical protein